MKYILEKQIEAVQRRIGEAPDAFALVRGSEQYGAVCGMVYFYQWKEGVLVLADIRHLPVSNEKQSIGNFFGFHIHEHGDCSGDQTDPFKNAGGHYNPWQQEHPFHAGDLPPLLGNRDGQAFSLFLTDRFQVAEILNRSVIIHGQPDDFTSQPAGNSGMRIACGPILKW